MIKYAHWTPDSGTTELPSLHRGVPLGDMQTTEVAWWEPKPPVMVTARYERGPRFPRIRKVLGALAVVAGCALLSAVPSPQLDAPAIEVLP